MWVQADYRLIRNPERTLLRRCPVEVEVSLGVITFADYHALGGVGGALERYAEGVFAELASRGLADRVRRVMLALVRSREGAAQATRRVVRRDRLTRDWDVVEELARRRLLVIDD